MILFFCLLSNRGGGGGGGRKRLLYNDSAFFESFDFLIDGLVYRNGESFCYADFLDFLDYNDFCIILLPWIWNMIFFRFCDTVYQLFNVVEEANIELLLLWCSAIFVCIGSIS